MAKATTCGHEPHKAKGLCSRCYMAAWREDNPDYKITPRETTCGHQPYHGNGLCVKCYRAAYYAENRDRILARDRAYTEADPERRVAQKQAWAAANPGYHREYYAANAETLREASKAWRRENREYAREWRRVWHQANAQRMVEQANAWKAANPERSRELARASTNRRRARKYADADLTNGQWQAILVEFDHRCAYCNCGGVPMEMEHMTPLSRGGRHTASNVVPACGPCNREKHMKTALEWIGPRAGMEHLTWP